LEYTQQFYLQDIILQAVAEDQAVPMTEVVICGLEDTAALEVEVEALPAVEIQGLKAGSAAKDLIVEATVLEKSELEPLGLITEAVVVPTPEVVAAAQAVGAV
jgi:hypothetical protein